jgi:hypothetical protein
MAQNPAVASGTLAGSTCVDDLLAIIDQTHTA